MTPDELRKYVLVLAKIVHARSDGDPDGELRDLIDRLQEEIGPSYAERVAIARANGMTYP